MRALEDYLTQLQDQHRRGQTVAETAYYPMLSNLLNEIGRETNTYVESHLKNIGAGIPDFGMYDRDQVAGDKPLHGVMEVKAVSADLAALAKSEQVRRYADQYGQVLITNLFQFMLVIKDNTGQPERYDLAQTEAEFFNASPHTLIEKHGAAFKEYLLRVLKRNVMLSTPQDVAWILASYAREAKARIERPDADLAALNTVRQQLEQALGVKFQDEEGREFFQSTLVQTLFYGIFSAWVLWHERHPREGETFDLWRDIRDLSLPAISEIFTELARPSRLRPLNIEDLLEYTAQALNRVDRGTFFQNFGRGDAVQYFYEPFLERFDPDLRRQLGVWYTPREVVEYMVARVDTVLREDLHIPDGLADPNVVVLDPCCGTGAYLVEVLRAIYERLKRREGDALAAQAVNQAIRERIFGFELLPAPFVVAHLQLGVLLNDLHAPLHEGNRAGVYLTNALTGWERTEKPAQLSFMPELQKERDMADAVKQQGKVLVILGNPPYSGYAGTAIDEERTLTNAYRTTVRAPRPQGQGLNDLYVRFFRMAERQIVEKHKSGVVCFISNYSWLDGLSHTGMREKYIEEFDRIWIDSLNGDKYRTGKRTPDGKADPSIFSTPASPEGIQVGTAIATMVRHTKHEQNKAICYRDLWGIAKRAQLKAEAKQQDIAYDEITPQAALGYPFMPRITGANYLDWVSVPDLFPVSFPGVKTSRDEALVEIDKERLIERMQKYFDPAIDHDSIRRVAPSLMGMRNPEELRNRLIQQGFSANRIVRYSYRAMDNRWLYWDGDTRLLDRGRSEYFPNVIEGNLWLELRQRESGDEFSRGTFTRVLADNFGNGLSSFFPLYFHEAPKKATLFEAGSNGGLKPNLSQKAKDYLAKIGADEKALFFHTLAVLHSPAYRLENAGALRQDFPRVPLPQDREALLESAGLGEFVAQLLDVETPVKQVTTGDLHPEVRDIAVLTRDQGPPDFAITAHWGRNQNGAVMPGQGRVVDHGDTLDIYLNETTYWKNVPRGVWEYTLGGYQVLKKWLSYRENSVLGRDLKPEEARDFMQIARRITVLIRLGAQLDGNYRRVVGEPHS